MTHTIHDRGSQAHRERSDPEVFMERPKTGHGHRTRHNMNQLEGEGDLQQDVNIFVVNGDDAIDHQRLPQNHQEQQPNFIPTRPTGPKPRPKTGYMRRRVSDFEIPAEDDGVRETQHRQFSASGRHTSFSSHQSNLYEDIQPAFSPMNKYNVLPSIGRPKNRTNNQPLDYSYTSNSSSRRSSDCSELHSNSRVQLPPSPSSSPDSEPPLEESPPTMYPIDSEQPFHHRPNDLPPPKTETPQESPVDCQKPQTYIKQPSPVASEATLVILALRLPNGSRLQNQFNSTDSLLDVIKYVVEKTGLNLSSETLEFVDSGSVERKSFSGSDLSVQLKVLGICDRTLLIIKEFD